MTDISRGYKQTEVGVIPEDWVYESLEKMSAFITKGSTPTTYGYKWEQSGILFLRSECVSERGLDLTQSMFISPAAHASLRRSEVCDGDILVTITGNVGRVVYLSGVDCANLNQHIARVRITSDRAVRQYVYHYLSQISIRRNFNTITTGQAYPQISLKQVREAVVALPPTQAEQEAIAEALSDADALIESLEQLIAKKRHIKQGAMQELLTGKKRLPGFNGEWEVKRLGDLASLYQPVTISAYQFTVAGYPVYGANGVVGFFDKFNHDTWQVTVTCRGSTCGTVNRTVDKCWITGNSMVVSCDGSKHIEKEFLYYLLLSQDLSICISGTGQPQIIRTPLANFELRIPSEKEEQTAIVTILSDMAAEIDALEARLTKARLIKQGMMQELLTGKTRLT